jgi:hypothetical protein
MSCPEVNERTWREKHLDAAGSRIRVGDIVLCDTADWDGRTSIGRVIGDDDEHPDMFWKVDCGSKFPRVHPGSEMLRRVNAPEWEISRVDNQEFLLELES